MSRVNWEEKKSVLERGEIENVLSASWPCYSADPEGHCVRDSIGLHSILDSGWFES